MTIASGASARADASNAQGAIERRGAAEAEPKAELDEAAALLLAAVEGMGESADDAAPAQLREHRVDGAAHVQQHRQRELGCQRQLGGEHLRLAGAVEAGNEVVEADLADGDQARVVATARERLAQRRQVAGADAVGAHRMDAQRVRQPVPVGELADALEVAGVDGRNDDLADAGGARPGDHLVAIGIEISGVEMAMRVDPHGAMMPAPGPRAAL